MSQWEAPPFARAPSARILLVIFIIQNTRAVRISFLGAHASLSYAVALLIAAIAGALLMAAAGTARTPSCAALCAGPGTAPIQAATHICPPATPAATGWWPHSRNALTELPGLIATLDSWPGIRGTAAVPPPRRTGEIPDRLTAGGHVVRVGWFTTIPRHPVSVTAAGQEPIALLVVPPGTAEGTAQTAMNMAVTGPGTAQAADNLTASELRRRAPRACSRMTACGTCPSPLRQRPRRGVRAPGGA
jgi:hypothetical protein